MLSGPSQAASLNCNYLRKAINIFGPSSGHALLIQAFTVLSELSSHN